MKQRHAIIALLSVTVVLVLQRYFGEQNTYYRLFNDGMSIGAMTWWAGAKILGYLVVPLVILAVLRIRPSDAGLGMGATRAHWKTYAALFLIVLPLVVVASRTEAFKATYPFYRGPHQVRWELLYALTFVSLEFFFRGYALFALEPVMGRIAVFVMVVPYTMIHFGKPLPEVLGAVVAGSVLGDMALRTRSVWGGVAVHLAVAWTMDFLALNKI